MLWNISNNIVKLFTKNVCKKLMTASPNRLYATATELKIDTFQKEEMMDHKLILVDETDRVVGSDTKLNCHLVKNGELLLHRAFSVLVFNSKNELVLQQRSSTKAFVPNCVTNTCCSHPLYDASAIHHQDAMQWTRETAVNRLIFELGIPPTDISVADLQFVLRMIYEVVDEDKVWGEHELGYLFVLHKDVNMTPHPMEVQKILTIPREEIINFIENPQYPLTPWFKIIYLKGWLIKIWDNLHNLEKISEKKKIFNFKEA